MPRIAVYPAASAYALRRLASAREVRLHSAYRNTLNVETEEGLVALQSAGSPLSPLSLLTPLDTGGMEVLAALARRGLALKPGGVLALGGPEGLLLTRGEGTELFDPRAPQLDPARLPALAARTRALLLAAGGRGLAALVSDGPGEDPVVSAARRRLGEAGEALKAGEPERAAACLLGLMGLGGGLTPAGDDFLCGAAALLWAAGREESPLGRALLSGMEDAKARTGDISAAFLRTSARGLASRAVCVLLGEGESRSFDQLKALFDAIGHSSGVDSLMGIDWILPYIKEELI